MSKNTNAQVAPITSTDEVVVAEQVQVEQVVEVAPVAQVEKFEPADVVNALFQSYSDDSRFTVYQVAAIINLAFEILEITEIKDGVEGIKRIAPQYLYNSTKSIRTTNEAKTGSQAVTVEQAKQIALKQLTKTGTITRGERIDTSSLKAQALASLKKA